jgi:CBS domain-containing protein
MQIRDVMSREVKLLAPDRSLQDAARLMRDHDIGVLPVGENDKLVGMITDRDIVLRAVADGKDCADVTVKDAMSKDAVLYCYEDQTTDEVADNMGEQRIRRLAVVDRDKNLVGIVSIGDLSRGAGPEKVGGAMAGIAATG